MTVKEFTIVREFDATPDRVWSAWIEPDQMAHWLPDGVSTPRESIMWRPPRVCFSMSLVQVMAPS